MNKATPLHFAIHAGNYYNAKVLLNWSASPNVKDAEGNTPLHLAVARKDLRLVRLLDESRGDATVENVAGLTAIDMAL